MEWLRIPREVRVVVLQLIYAKRPPLEQTTLELVQ